MHRVDKINTNKWIGAGLLAAVGASVCCIAPLVAFVAGIGGVASSFAWLDAFRPVLIALTLLALGFAWYFKLFPSKQTDCACDHQPQTMFMQSKKFLMLVTFFAIAMLAFPTYAHLLYGKQQEDKISSAATTETVVINIKGMTCSGCEAHVNSEVGKVKGVSSVKTSYDNGSTVVKYDASKTSINQIKEAVNKTGYAATKITKAK